VEPAVAAHQLRPGEDVGFIDGGVGHRGEVLAGGVPAADHFLAACLDAP
jgi:hypothetical protein